MNRKKAIIYVIIASLLWSIGGLFIKLIDLNPLAIAGGRSGIAALVMFIYMKQPIHKIKLTRYKILGGLSYAMVVVLFVTATKLTTSANAILLQFTSPIWVALFTVVILKEKVRLSDWLAITAVFGGLIIFLIDGLSHKNLLGNTAGVLSGIAMASMVLFLRNSKEESPLEITFIGNIITLILCIPFFFEKMPNVSSLAGLSILGVFQLGIAYIFYTKAIHHVSALEGTLIPILEPLLNPVWVLLVTKETPSLYAFIGGLLVLTSVIGRGIYQGKVTNKTITNT